VTVPRLLLLAVLVLLSSAGCGCGGTGLFGCGSSEACVQGGQGDVCAPTCTADGGSCPSGTTCVGRSGCCSGTGCAATFRYVCCPASGC
jgi:hypothetical protein